MDCVSCKVPVAFNTSPSSNTKGCVNNSVVVAAFMALVLNKEISAGPKLLSDILKSIVSFPAESLHINNDLITSNCRWYRRIS